MQNLARDHERPDDREDAAVAMLRALEALLNVDGSDGAFAVVFRSLRALFAFDRAMLLDADGGEMRCLAAVPLQQRGRCWAGDHFQSVVSGSVLALNRDADAATWQVMPPDLVSFGQSALAFPIGVAQRPAVVLVVREAGREGFGADDIALARTAAVVALAGLAVHSEACLEAEIRRLNLVVEQLRESEQSAQRDYKLLRDIVELLPCGVTVRDDQGYTLLVNALAAGGIPADDEAARRQLREIAGRRSGQVTVHEDRAAGEGGERTWLTAHRPVRIDDQTLLLSSSTDITERKQIEEEWTRRAYFDDLTGLPNRLFMQERVTSVIHRTGDDGRLALAFIDIDNFKHINDYYSHAVGDALLVEVARRLSNALRETDLLARISGDEFLLLLDPLDDTDQVQAIIDRILADMKRPFYVDTFEIFTSASIGVSHYPEQGEDYESLRRNADTAMYRVKSGTKGAALFFDPEMGRSITARMEHEQQLRLAIRDNRFCCAFQPKVDIYTQQVAGFESLVRWRDENGENRPPSTFISLAIELGLVDAITDFMLSETLKSIERLDESFGAGTTFSINIPAQLAGDIDFMHPFIDAMKSSGRAERLMLELTEDTFVATNPFQAHVLPLLRGIGVRISVDDFGTGYSSFASLADITADELKVDRSFITDIHRRPRSQGILKSIESLGHSLDMNIVAEGVETIEELAYLQEVTRIRHAQGFYFCKPFFLDDAPGARNLSAGARGIEAPRERFEGNRVRVARGRA